MESENYNMPNSFVVWLKFRWTINESHKKAFVICSFVDMVYLISNIYDHAENWNLVDHDGKVAQAFFEGF